MTPKECYDRLRPQLEAIGKQVKAAPLTLPDRAALALLAAGHLFGYAGAAFQESMGDDSRAPSSRIARQVADLMVAAIEKGEARQRQ